MWQLFNVQHFQLIIVFEQKKLWHDSVEKWARNVWIIFSFVLNFFMKKGHFKFKFSILAIVLKKNTLFLSKLYKKIAELRTWQELKLENLPSKRLLLISESKRNYKTYYKLILIHDFNKFKKKINKIFYYKKPSLFSTPFQSFIIFRL